ncbi:cysteine desulfurase family protein [Sinimarinibacterium flocculans]|uniref:cysteine desulfurase family protein n=1 Tax=Sinimarinibacterium flocculans TaxID=985250 RepID=UPI003516AB03
MTLLSDSRIFLDYQSTTPVDQRVVEVMLPYFLSEFGNPHSAEHSFGLRAMEAVERALECLAKVINADAGDIVITSGATESNNMALRGAVSGKKRLHIVSSATEHRSILGTLSAIQDEGHAVSLIEVDDEGLIDLDALHAAIRPNTRLVSIMAVNSEIGVVQPYADIGAICRSRDVLFHVDAAQGFGRVPIDVLRDHIDLLSVSAHKIYGPKGVGALYIGPRAKKVIRPLITGGGQQDGWRAGTLPTPLVVGFGAAADLMLKEGDAELKRIAMLGDRLWRGLIDQIGSVHLNGSADRRYAGNLNVRIDGVDADSLLLLLPDIALSTGSACTSGTPEPSAVLRALGLSVEEARQSVRIGLGRMTTVDEVDEAVRRIASAVQQLR